ncbi:MAG TPA: hypothetical protein VHE83_14770 [Mycobacteriales bacterium]|nr:hypothetical protein [Mycobacteriales bacterium]
MGGDVVALTGPRRAVLEDARDGDRAVMATWHLDEGYLVLSLWRGETCVASARLLPSQAAQLSQLISKGLGELVATFESFPAEDVG